MPSSNRPPPFGTFLLLLLLFLSFQSISFCLPSSSASSPISPRFLHFSLQIRAEWLLDIENRILAVFENMENGPKSWQIAVQLFANHPSQGMPFTSLLNISRGQKAIRADQMAECGPIEGKSKSVQLEIELSPQFIFVRAKNAAKYALPSPLVGSADLRVYFVQIEAKGAKGEGQRICQLDSEMDAKETSRFALPSTTPHPPINPSTTIPPIGDHSPVWNATIVEEEEDEEEGIILPNDQRQGQGQGQQKEGKGKGKGKGKPPSEWPLYKRKRIKVPRRSTMAAQRFLSPNHYVPQQDWAIGRQKQRMFPPRPSQPTPGWPFSGIDAGGAMGTTMASYIDIIRDRQLYEEVQRSRTMEINSRWSFIFLLFMGLIAVLISISAAFALLMFILLQCRPKAKKPLLLAA